MNKRTIVKIPRKSRETKASGILSQTKNVHWILEGQMIGLVLIMTFDHDFIPPQERNELGITYEHNRVLVEDAIADSTGGRLNRVSVSGPTKADPALTPESVAVQS
jgi:hypothetical protein